MQLPPFLTHLTFLRWEKCGPYGANSAIHIEYRGVVLHRTGKFTSFYDLRILRRSDLRGFLGLVQSLVARLPF
jgi:hypothetical protein